MTTAQMDNMIDPFQVPSNIKTNDLEFDDVFGNPNMPENPPAKAATLDFKDINKMGMQLQNRM